ncbi:hypothetical protein MMC11_005697 [Xylographa trunciseda]|nr:hypothetical protein [Xylographa trunciseda]
MAAANHWKRPWEEKVDEDHGFPRHTAPGPVRLSTLQFQQRPTRSEYGTRLQHSGESAPFSQDHSEPMSGSSSKQDLSPISQDKDRNLKRPNRQASLSSAPKRPCIRYLEDGDADLPNLHAPVPTSSAPAFQLEGVQGSRYDQGNRSGRASAPELNLGRTYEQSLRGSTRELTEPSYTYDTIQYNPQTACQTCTSLRGVVHEVVSAVDNLHGDLSVFWKDFVPGQHEVLTLESSKTTRPLPQCPLDQALEWVVERLNSSIRLLKEASVPRTTFPPNLLDTMIYGERKLGKSSVRENLRDKWERGGRRELPMNKLFNQQSETDSPLKADTLRALPSFEGERRKSIAGEYGSGHLPYSPSSTAASTGPHLSFLQSPTQAPVSNRPLPSPSSLNFSSSQFLPPLSPLFMGPKSPHTAHLQELQHQLSTKSLAHQILQGEHDKLLAAYSRSQIRCATLDKKSQVSDNEINNLVEDRLRLQSQVNAIEIQVDELQHSKDEAQKQSVASGSQYMQIMGMSSRLQAQAAADLKIWKTDRDDWQNEKELLLAKIASLELEAHGSRSSPAPMPSILTLRRQSLSGLTAEATETDVDLGDVLMSKSVEVLRAEIVKLRMGSREAENSLQAWRSDSFYLEEVMGKLNIIETRMRKRAIDTNTGTATPIG